MNGGLGTLSKKRPLPADDGGDDDESSSSSDDDAPLIPAAKRLRSSADGNTTSSNSRMIMTSENVLPSSTAHSGNAAHGGRVNQSDNSASADTGVDAREAESEDSDDDDVPLIKMGSGCQAKRRAASAVSPTSKSPVQRRQQRPTPVKRQQTESPRVKSEAPSPRPTATRVNVKTSESQQLKKPPVKRQRKLLKKTEENFEPVNCWWAKESYKDGVQWKYLEHHGMIFAPPYEPHGIPIRYAGVTVELPPSAEEVINYWVGAQNSDYVTKVRYVTNFWNAFLCRLPADHPIKTGELLLGFESDTPAKELSHALPEGSGTPNASDAAFAGLEKMANGTQNGSGGTKAASRKGEEAKKGKGPERPRMDLFDCSEIRQHLEDQRDRKKLMTKEQKQETAAANQLIEGPHQYCLFDWLREKVANLKMEPPNLFRGRGDHPKMGQLKRRVFPEEVTFNCAEDAPVARLPPDLRGHSWKDIYHDNTVAWLAFYRDCVNGTQYKYMQLAGGSVVKGKSDNKKYEKARQLKGCIHLVKNDYNQKMLSRDVIERQLGTATYLIDFLALRIGNEKDVTEMADTVGCCSLRIEHATFNEDEMTLTLDFLGKDSIRYFNTVQICPTAFKNLKAFCRGKDKDELIFDKISTMQLNKYLKELMPSLSAKVFRTYNASITLQEELKRIYEANADISNSEDIIRFYNDANRQVAILCNHQRSVPKQHDASMGKLQRQLERLMEDMKELQAFLVHLRSRPTKKFKFESQLKLEEGEVPRKSVVTAKMKEQQVHNKLKMLSTRKATWELRMRVKDENKTVSNSTSKQHYMDPRITVAFCKKFELPIEKLFNKALQKNFSWAMYSPTTFEF